MTGTLYPALMGSDETSDRIPAQNFNPVVPEFAVNNAVNVRTPINPATQLPMVDQYGEAVRISSHEVSQRGTKNVVWSSEGFSLNGLTINALSSGQKAATGSHSTNVGGTAPLDFSPFRNLAILINLVSFTGGSSPTIQFEFDMQDDTATPVPITLFKPTAANAAAAYYISIGPGVAFAQAASAPATAATGFGAISVPSGLTYYSYPLVMLPQGSFKWTVANTPTGIAWSAWIYGVN